MRIDDMRKILMKIGKDFASNQWSFVASNQNEIFSLCFQEGFTETIPYPGGVLNEEDILKMIDFLCKTLQEREENEQSNME